MTNAIAYKSILADYGIEILKIDNSEDLIYFTWTEGNKKSHIRKSTIRIDHKGNSYFISRKQRHYLNEFTRTNI